MKKILQLLGILTFVICNYGNAKELKCEYELKNLNIEPVRVANAKRTYTVYISCKYTSVHHTGETGGPIPLRKTITPVVTGTDDEKEGKAEAYAEGESTVIAMARLRLTEECGLQCGNCNEVGCTCVGCNDIVAVVRRFAQSEKIACADYIAFMSVHGKSPIMNFAFIIGYNIIYCVKFKARL